MTGRADERHTPQLRRSLSGAVPDDVSLGQQSSMTSRDVLVRPVFAVDGDECTWADVIDAARAWGVWAEVEDAAVTSPRARPGAADPLAVEEQAEAIRRDHGLLSADQTVAWLAHWGVSLSEWLAHLRRRLAGERPSDLEAATWIEAVTSGMLERAAQRLARALAVNYALGGNRALPMEALDSVLELWTRVAASPEHVAKAVEDRRLAWTTFELYRIELEDEDVAREVFYSVRDGRRSFAEMGAAVRVPVQRYETPLEALARELRPILAAARPGDLVGPLPVDGRWIVVGVEARFDPSPDDPDVAARARDYLVAESVRREVARRVRWLDVTPWQG